MRITLDTLRRVISEELRRIVEAPVQDPEELASEPEYATVEDFVQFKMDEEEPEFSFVDLQALNMSLQRPVSSIRAELEGYGMKLSTRSPEKRTRGFTTSSNDRWFGPGSLKTHGGAGIDSHTGRATTKGGI